MQRLRKAGLESTFLKVSGRRAQLRRVQHALFLLAQSLHRCLRWISTHRIVRERAREPASRFALLALFSSSSTSPPCSSSLFTARFAQRWYSSASIMALPVLAAGLPLDGARSLAHEPLFLSLDVSLTDARDGTTRPRESTNVTVQ